jgi:hypothetical protein
LAQSPSEIAIGVFAFNFSQGAYLDYLPTLFASTKSDILETSLEAVSMLCYARQARRDSLMRNATLTYSLALSKTQKALDPSHATQDHVLAAVMLLALYAALSADSTHASAAWTKHIYGALALAALRPHDSFGSFAAQRLLSHVVSSIQLDCIQRRERLPPQLRALYGVAMPDGGDFYLRFSTLIENLAELRASAAKDPSCRSAMAARVLELDQEADFLLGLMPPAESFERLRDVGGEVYHVYSGYRSAQSWNTLRLARLALMELMSPVGCSLTYDDKVSVEDPAEEPSKVVSSMVGDIYHSVPRFLRPSQSEPRSDSSAWIGSLIWPLGQALASPFISRHWHQQVLNQLLHFSRISKDAQISTAARLLCEGESANEW